MISISEAGSQRHKQLRDFGLVMALALIIFGGILFWRGRETSLLLFAGASCFLTAAIFSPDRLERLERLWMKLAQKLSAVTTFILVTLIFYLTVTPIALLMKLLRRDFLGLRFEPEKKSYWIPAEKDGPGTRPFTPY